MWAKSNSISPWSGAWRLGVLVAMVLVCAGSMAQAAPPAGFATQPIDLRIQLVDQDGKPVPDAEIARATDAIFLKAEFNYYAGKRRLASNQVPIRSHEKGVFRLQARSPVAQAEALGVDVKSMDRVEMVVQLPFSAKFPYAGSTSVDLASHVAEAGQGKIQPLQLPVVHRAPGKAVEVKCRLVSSVTGRPIPGRELRGPARQKLRTDEDGLVTVRIPDAGKECYVGEAPKPGAHMERFSGAKLTPADLAGYQQTQHPIEMRTDRPAVVVKLVPDAADSTESVEPISGVVRVTHALGEKRTVETVHPVRKGYFVLYPSLQEEMQARHPVAFDLTKGQAATYRIAADGSRLVALSPKGHTMTLSLPVAPLKQTTLSVVVRNAATKTVVPRAQVTVFEKPQPASAPGAPLLADAKGTVVLKQTWPRKYGLRVSATGYEEDWVVHDFVQDPTAEVELHAVVDVTARMAGESPVKASSSVLLVARDQRFRQYGGVLTDEPGVFRFAGVPEGKAFLVFMDGQHRVVRRCGVDVTADAVLTAPETKVYPLRVRLETMDSNHTPRLTPGVQVVEWETGIPLHKPKHTDSWNTVDLQVPAGSYCVYALLPGGMKKLGMLDVGPAQQQSVFTYQVDMTAEDDLLRPEDAFRPQTKEPGLRHP